MSWESGAFWIGGIVILSIGVGIKYGYQEGMILLGIMLAVTALLGDWE